MPDSNTIDIVSINTGTGSHKIRDSAALHGTAGTDKVTGSGGNNSANLKNIAFGTTAPTTTTGYINGDIFIVYEP